MSSLNDLKTRARKAAKALGHDLHRFQGGFRFYTYCRRCFKDVLIRGGQVCGSALDGPCAMQYVFRDSEKFYGFELLLNGVMIDFWAIAQFTRAEALEQARTKTQPRRENDTFEIRFRLLPRNARY